MIELFVVCQNNSCLCIIFVLVDCIPGKEKFPVKTWLSVHAGYLDFNCTHQSSSSLPNFKSFLKKLFSIPNRLDLYIRTYLY